MTAPLGSYRSRRAASAVPSQESRRLLGITASKQINGARCGCPVTHGRAKLLFG